MLYVRIQHEGKSVNLPGITQGQQPGTITDYTKPETEIILFKLDEGGVGRVLRSLAGWTVERGAMRELHSANLKEIEIVQPGETKTIPFKSKYGMCDLVLENRP